MSDKIKGMVESLIEELESEMLRSEAEKIAAEAKERIGPERFAAQKAAFMAATALMDAENGNGTNGDMLLKLFSQLGQGGKLSAFLQGDDLTAAMAKLTNAELLALSFRLDTAHQWAEAASEMLMRKAQERVDAEFAAEKATEGFASVQA